MLSSEQLTTHRHHKNEQEGTKAGQFSDEQTPINGVGRNLSRESKSTKEADDNKSPTIIFNNAQDLSPELGDTREVNPLSTSQRILSTVKPAHRVSFQQQKDTVSRIELMTTTTTTIISKTTAEEVQVSKNSRSSPSREDQGQVVVSGTNQRQSCLSSEVLEGPLKEGTNVGKANPETRSKEKVTTAGRTDTDITKRLDGDASHSSNSKSNLLRDFNTSKDENSEMKPSEKSREEQSSPPLLVAQASSDSSSVVCNQESSPRNDLSQSETNKDSSSSKISATKIVESSTPKVTTETRKSEAQVVSLSTETENLHKDEVRSNNDRSSPIANANKEKESESKSEIRKFLTTKRHERDLDCHSPPRVSTSELPNNREFNETGTLVPQSKLVEHRCKEDDNDEDTNIPKKKKMMEFAIQTDRKKRDQHKLVLFRLFMQTEREQLQDLATKTNKYNKIHDGNSSRLISDKTSKSGNSKRRRLDDKLSSKLFPSRISLLPGALRELRKQVVDKNDGKKRHDQQKQSDKGEQNVAGEKRIEKGEQNVGEKQRIDEGEKQQQSEGEKQNNEGENRPLLLRSDWASRSMQELESLAYDRFVSSDEFYRAYRSRQTTVSQELSFCAYGMEYNELSLQSVSNWVNKVNDEDDNLRDKTLVTTTTEDPEVVVLETVEINQSKPQPATQVILRKCQLCGYYGHYEVECERMTEEDEIELSQIAKIHIVARELQDRSLGGANEDVSSSPQQNGDGNETKVDEVARSNSEEADDESIHESSCEICGSHFDGAHMLICDGCNKLHHLYCLNPPLERIPKGDWFCHECSDHDEDVGSDAEVEVCDGFVIEQRKKPREKRRDDIEFSSTGYQTVVAVVEDDAYSLPDPDGAIIEEQTEIDGFIVFSKSLSNSAHCRRKRDIKSTAEDAVSTGCTVAWFPSEAQSSKTIKNKDAMGDPLVGVVLAVDAEARKVLLRPIKEWEEILKETVTPNTVTAGKGTHGRNPLLSNITAVVSGSTFWVPVDEVHIVAAAPSKDVTENFRLEAYSRAQRCRTRRKRKRARQTYLATMK